jgi:superfamily II DNA helicase RecQ
MALENESFRADIQAIKSQIDKVVIDEAHVCTQWGGEFQRKYSQLGNLRAILDPSIPTLATSATMTPECQKGVLNTVLLFNKKDTFVVNLGNDRPNIELSLEVMTGTKKKPPDLNFIGEELREIKRLRRRMIFVDSCNGTEDICKYVRTLLPPDKRTEVASYHAQHGSLTKEVLMERFRAGKINILVTTEAAGMVRTVDPVAGQFTDVA